MPTQAPTELHCPNPACSDAIEPRPVHIFGNTYQVQCPCCGMAGPKVGGEREAVRAWERMRMDSTNAARPELAAANVA